MSVSVLLDQLRQHPETVQFNDVIRTVEAHYAYTPTRFSNGDVVNEAGQNAGSCKVFAFAQLNGLTPTQTLACFGHYYRDDVLGNPTGTDHANIRNFMRTGWDGIRFDADALQLLSAG